MLLATCRGIRLRNATRAEWWVRVDASLTTEGRDAFQDFMFEDIEDEEAEGITQVNGPMSAERAIQLLYSDFLRFQDRRRGQ